MDDFLEEEEEKEYVGMSRREYFAALAMQGLLASSKIFDAQTIAESSVMMADALEMVLDRKTQ